MRQLSVSGLRKMIRFLEDIADDCYGSCGGLNIRIANDGNLRIDAHEPHSLIDEARKYDLHIAYLGRDMKGEYCYQMFDISEDVTQPAAIAAPATGAAPATAAAQAPAAQPPSPEAAGRAGEEDVQQQMAKQLGDVVLRQVMANVEGEMDAFKETLAQKISDFSSQIEKIK